MTDETDALAVIAAYRTAVVEAIDLIDQSIQAVIALLREITDELHQLKGKSDEKTASQAEPGQGPDGPP